MIGNKVKFHHNNKTKEGYVVDKYQGLVVIRKANPTTRLKEEVDLPHDFYIIDTPEGFVHVRCSKVISKTKYTPQDTGPK